MIDIFKNNKIDKQTEMAIYYNKIKQFEGEYYFHILFKPRIDIINNNKIFFDKITDHNLKDFYIKSNGFSAFSGSFVIGGFTEFGIPHEFNTLDIISLTNMNIDKRNHQSHWITIGTISIDDDYGFLVLDNKKNQYYLVSNFQKYKILKKWKSLHILFKDIINYYKTRYTDLGVSKTYNTDFDPMVANLVNYKY